MESAPQADWKSGLRTVAFALLAAAIVLGLVSGWYMPFAEEARPGEARMLVRGGDRFMQAYYLALDAGWEEDRARSLLLRRAGEFYLAAREADPDDLRTSLSAALVLCALGRRIEAASRLRPWERGQLPEPTRKAVGAAYAMVLSEHPAPEALENAHDYLFGLGPGPLLIANGYRDIGEATRAEATLAEAAAQSRPLRRTLIIAVGVNGGIVLWGVVWLLQALVRRRSRAPATDSAHGPASTLLGPREATEAFILWVFFGTVFSKALSSLPAEAEAFALASPAPSVLAALIAIAWVWLAAPRGARVGWRLTSLRSRVAAGLAGAGLSVIPVLLIYRVIQERLGRSPADDPVLQLLTLPETVWGKALIVVAVGMVAPALEETLFRGILFGGLRRRWSFWAASTVSAALFAIVHLNVAGFASYFLLGLLFAYLFERTQSLAAPWAAHAAFNMFNLVMLFALFG